MGIEKKSAAIRPCKQKRCDRPTKTTVTSVTKDWVKEKELGDATNLSEATVRLCALRPSVCNRWSKALRKDGPKHRNLGLRRHTKAHMPVRRTHV